MLVGGDTDKHGCIPSGGYQWSEVKGECIRVFEDGIRLNNKLDTTATTSDFIVFNSDSSKVELFTDDDKSKILARKGYSWANKYIIVSKANGKWIMYDHHNKRLYGE